MSQLKKLLGCLLFNCLIAAGICFGFWFLDFGFCLAEEVPVNIKADVLKYSEDKSMVTASGNVKVELEGIIINADRLTMDTSTNVVTAEGNILMSSRNYNASAKAITYNISNEVSTFLNFKSVQSPSNIKGNLYLFGEEITDYKKKTIGREGGVTTCDKPEPHSFAMAKRIEYYPDDCVKGYWVTFYEGWIGKYPVMTAPYLYYDLKKKHKKNWTIGHNEVEGDFIKTVWDTPLFREGSILLLDWMDKKGIGLGGEAEYGDDSSIYLYGLEEKDTKIQDRVVKLNHNKNIDRQTKLSLLHSSKKIYAIPSGRFDQFYNKINWSHNGEHQTNLSVEQLDDEQQKNERYNFTFNHEYKEMKTDFSSALDQGKTTPRSIRVNHKLTHSQPLLFPNTSFRSGFNYTDAITKAGDIGDERLDIDYTINHRNNFFSLSIFESFYIDPDGTNYTADSNLQYLEMKPEIILTPNPQDLKLFSLASSVGYGWYHEVQYVPLLGGNRDFSTGRYSANVNASRIIPLPLGNNLNLKAGIIQYRYEPGDEMYAFSEQAGLTTNLLERVRNQISFRRGISEGNSPFLFDKLNTNYSNLSESFSLYYQTYFDWTTTCGYNFQARTKDNLQTGMRISPTKRFNLNWNSGYDLNFKKYIDLTYGIMFEPLDGLILKINANQDINIGLLKSSNSEIDWEIGREENWEGHGRLKLGAVYDPATLQYKVVDVMLTKDLHCFEVKYMYSDYRKEFSLTFTLKALPEEPFGYTQGGGFYFEGFDKTIKQELNQETIRRY